MHICCHFSIKRKEGILKLPLFASLMTCHEIRPHPISYNGKPFTEYQRADEGALLKFVPHITRNGNTLLIHLPNKVDYL